VVWGELPGGMCTSVSPDTPTAQLPSGTVRLSGLTLPGLANAHSHAFHRALRGSAAGDTFWAWRDRMYRVAERLDPDRYFALARAVYCEMALAGITCVGEFHYLHHGQGGIRYSDPNEIGGHARLGAAIHSVRAVSPDQVPEVMAWSHAHGAPVHAHLSEQPLENAECRAAFGATPTEVLYEAGALGPRSTMVHATHLVPH